MNADDRSAHSNIYNKKKIKHIILSLVIAYVLLIGTMSFGFKPGNRLTDSVLRISYSFSVLGTLFATLWASKRSRSYKRLWRLMAFGIFLWLIGEMIYLSYVITLGALNVPSPNVADLFAIAYIPIILGVMFSIGRIRPPLDLEKKKFLINVSMVALGLFLVLVKFIILPAWYAKAGFTGILYPVLDWIILVSLLFASRRFINQQIEGWVILLASAFLSAVLGDIFYYIFGNQRNPLMVLSMVGLATLVSLSAVDEVTGAFIGIRYRLRKKAKDVSHSQSILKSPHLNIAIPSVTTLIIPVVWLTFSYSQDSVIALIMFSVSAAIVVLAGYNYWLIATDNSMLLAASLRDSLTNLYNHRYFQESLEKEILKSDATGKPVSLLILDIDDFSQVNNSYGHSSGDMTLKSIGDAILSTLREADEAYRLSGDKMAVIMPDTRRTEAHIFADRLKNSISNAVKSVFPEKPVTVTIGISTYPAPAGSKDDLISMADGALYWGKYSGKNTVVVYDPEVVEVVSAEERARKAEEKSFLDIVMSLAEAVDARDSYTRLHSQGVSFLAGKLAKALEFSNEMISKIEAAGTLHDVGKIGIPDVVLNKPGRLTEEEMDIIKNHPVISAQIIQSTSLKEMVPAIRSHHERWDGKGYPDGLKGEEIPLEARILAVADTYNAMTTDRPYRKALSVNDALTEIEKCAGTQFDPKIAEVFLSMFNVDDQESHDQLNRVEQDKVQEQLGRKLC